MSGRNNTVGFSSQGKLFSNGLPCLSLIYDFKEILDGFPVSTELRNHRWNFGTGVFLQLLRVFQIFQECFNKGIKLIISSIKENVKKYLFFPFAIACNCNGMNLNQYQGVFIQSCLLQQ